MRRCLEKNRKRRLADIADARLEIEEPVIAAETQAPRPISATRGKLAWVFAITVLGVAVLLRFAYIRQAPLQPPTTRFQLPLPEKTTTPMFRVSPDGRMLAISASEGGRSRLWIRPLDALDATPLAGTDDATYPFWSPDSATWNVDGVIVFSEVGSGLFRVPAAGGVPTRLTTKAANTPEVHRFPDFLPGGSRFLFTIIGAGGSQRRLRGFIGWFATRSHPF